MPCWDLDRAIVAMLADSGAQAGLGPIFCTFRRAAACGRVASATCLHAASYRSAVQDIRVCDDDGDFLSDSGGCDTFWNCRRGSDIVQGRSQDVQGHSRDVQHDVPSAIFVCSVCARKPPKRSLQVTGSLQVIGTLQVIAIPDLA